MQFSSASLQRLVPRRIRNRRDALGLPAFVVAKKAGISGSYLSLIEKGAKVPSEEIAVRLARALDDDPEIYRAWVHAARHPDLIEDAERVARFLPYRDDPELRRRLASGESIEAPPPEPANGLQAASLRLGRMAGRADSSPDMFADDCAMMVLERCDVPPATVEVPVLADGVDPEHASNAVPRLQFDPVLLPPAAEGLFAYRPGPAAVARVRDLLRPGDLVVLADPRGTVERGGIHAVRYREGIVLSRVALYGDVLLLLPGDEAGELLAVPLRSETSLRERLAGVVVAAVRLWSPGARRTSAGPAARPAPSGRSVRLEGDFLVRDCDWRDDYGWRPVQRPEDMDFLDEHPGTRIRFRLLRDGHVRYLLEMGPEEWRGALGDYYEGPGWRRNGYIVAVTRRRGGRYTEEFQERWAPYVRRCDA